jgi:hypothetical protein
VLHDGRGGNETWGASAVIPANAAIPGAEEAADAVAEQHTGLGSSDAAVNGGQRTARTPPADDGQDGALSCAVGSAATALGASGQAVRDQATAADCWWAARLVTIRWSDWWVAGWVDGWEHGQRCAGWEALK